MALSADDIKRASDDAQKYSAELDQLAQAHGIDPKDAKGNDAGELLKATGAGLATGAAVGAAVGAAFPPFAPILAAAGALIGAIAGFFARFRFGPSAEQIALSAEFDRLNHTIHAILETVPHPYRAQFGKILLDEARGYPGPIPFCVTYTNEQGLNAGGCVQTSMDGVRAAAAGIEKQAQDWIARASADLEAAKRRRAGIRFGLGAVLAAGVGYGLYRWEKRK